MSYLAIERKRQKIEDTGDLTQLQTEVDDLETTVGGFQSGINTNTGNIGANTNAINTNTGNITTINGYITTNTGHIAANTTNIGDNTADIATNSGNITVNQTDIGNNTTNIAANSGAITTLQSSAGKLQELEYQLCFGGTAGAGGATVTRVNADTAGVEPAYLVPTSYMYDNSLSSIFRGAGSTVVNSSYEHITINFNRFVRISAVALLHSEKNERTNAIYSSHVQGFVVAGVDGQNYTSQSPQLISVMGTDKGISDTVYDHAYTAESLLNHDHCRKFIVPVALRKAYQSYVFKVFIADRHNDPYYALSQLFFFEDTRSELTQFNKFSDLPFFPARQEKQIMGGDKGHSAASSVSVSTNATDSGYEKMFDNKVGYSDEGWQTAADFDVSTTDAVINITFSGGVKLSKFIMLPGSVFGPRPPKAFKIYGSNTNNNFSDTGATELYTVTYADSDINTAPFSYPNGTAQSNIDNARGIQAVIPVDKRAEYSTYLIKITDGPLSGNPQTRNVIAINELFVFKEVDNLDFTTEQVFGGNVGASGFAITDSEVSSTSSNFTFPNLYDNKLGVAFESTHTGVMTPTTPYKLKLTAPKGENFVRIVMMRAKTNSYQIPQHFKIYATNEDHSGDPFYINDKDPVLVDYRDTVQYTPSSITDYIVPTQGDTALDAQINIDYQGNLVFDILPTQITKSLIFVFDNIILGSGQQLRLGQIVLYARRFAGPLVPGLTPPDTQIIGGAQGVPSGATLTANTNLSNSFLDKSFDNVCGGFGTGWHNGWNQGPSTATTPNTNDGFPGIVKMVFSSAKIITRIIFLPRAYGQDQFARQLPNLLYIYGTNNALATNTYEDSNAVLLLTGTHTASSEHVTYSGTAATAAGNYPGFVAQENIDHPRRVLFEIPLDKQAAYTTYLINIPGPTAWTNQNNESAIAWTELFVFERS